LEQLPAYKMEKTVSSMDSLTYLGLQNLNSASPTFNATFNMVMLNGSAPPKHTIF